MEPAYRAAGGADGSYRIKRTEAEGGGSACRRVRRRASKERASDGSAIGPPRRRIKLRSKLEHRRGPAGCSRESARKRSRPSASWVSPRGSQHARRDLVAYGGTARVSPLVSGTRSPTDGLCLVAAVERHSRPNGTRSNVTRLVLPIPDNGSPLLRLLVRRFAGVWTSHGAVCSVGLESRRPGRGGAATLGRWPEAEGDRQRAGCYCDHGAQVLARRYLPCLWRAVGDLDCVPMPRLRCPRKGRVMVGG